jgi:hypothetical protein
MPPSLLKILSGLILIEAAFLIGCEKDNTARIYGPTDNPVMVGQWKGTVTALVISGSDTLMAATAKARYSFTDTSFTYRLLDNYNSTIQPYVGAGRYERDEEIVYLQDTTTYDQYVDRSRTPIPDEPYELTLTSTKMTLLWLHDYGSGMVRSQNLVLIRDK